MRTFLLLTLLLPAFLVASGGTPASGPGQPHGLDQAWIDEVLRDLSPVTGQDLNTAMTAEETAQLNAMFAAPPVLSDRSDDIRKVAEITGNLKNTVDSARAILNTVRDGARQIANLVDAQLTNLPLGIKQQFGNTTVFLAIGQARLKPMYAEVDLYLGLDLPNTEQDPIFMARGVRWSRKGGFVGEVELQLIADWGIDMQAGKSRLILHRMSQDGSRGTGAVVTCEGLQSAQLSATVLLSRDWVVPVVNGEALVDPNLNDERDPYSTARVCAHFNTSFDRETGFFFETNFGTPFAFTSKEDIHIKITQVVVDLSSSKNTTSPPMAFPEGYQNPFVDEQTGAADVRWEGLYISGVTITIPDNFRKDADEDLVVGAPQIIIDQTGVTAHLYATGIMPLGNKTVDKWAFSVDSVDLKLMHSNFEQAAITGLINVPILAGAAANCGGGTVDPDAPVRNEDCLSYIAQIRPGSYYFGVRVNQDYCIPVFKGSEVIVEQNTRVDLEYTDNEFTAQATLYATFNIDAELGDGGFRVDGLSVDELVLRTDTPYFEPGLWDFPSAITANYKGFELGFREIHMAKDSVNENGGRNCQLFFQAYVSFDGSFDLDATGAFRVLGELKETETSQKWTYRSVKLDAFSIYASTSSFTVGAALAFYGQDDPDPVWGSGFYGYGELLLHGISGTDGFAAVANFGKKDGKRYFLVDVMGVFASTPIPVAPGLNLGAVGGGIYSNMSANQAFLGMEEDGGDDLDEIATAIDNARGPSSSPLTGIVGRSLSGKQYMVTGNGGFGLFVQLVLIGPNPKAYSITGMFELEINGSQGWSASIQAAAQAMVEPNYTGNLKIEEGVGIYARVEVIKNGDEISFEATAEVFVNVADGRLRGINSDGLPSDPGRSRYVGQDGFAGGLYLKFSNEEWYFYVGRPTAPLGVELLGLGSWAYFCVGSTVPPIPPLPDNVLELAGDIDMSRDFSEYQNAAGFAFGAGIDMAADGEFLIFYYDVFATVGFDINIRNYGDAVCLNDGPNGPAIGVNGWYAAGQAYAYVEGSIGIDVKILFVNVRKEILSAGVAAVLQLKGPNPTTGRGVVAGRYSILGGVIKGRFRIDASFGDNCVIVGRDGDDPFEGIDLIVGSTIRDGDVDVETSAIPEFFTTMPVYTTTDMNGTDYRMQLITNELSVAATNEVVVSTTYGFNDEYGFKALGNSYLEPLTEYRYYGQVKVEKKNGYSWDEVKVEDKEIVFTTGAAIDVIEPENVKAAYPYDGMVNLYVEEHDEGQIELTREQASVTEGLKAVWVSTDGLERVTTVTTSGRFLRYNIPQQLPSDQIFRLDLVQHYPSGGGQGTGNQQPPPGSLDAMAPEFDLALINGLTNEPRVVYSAFFRTSNYRTFEEKVTALTDNIRDRSGDTAWPRQTTSDEEGWSASEMTYNEVLDGPMVQVRIDNEPGWPTTLIRERYLPNAGEIIINGQKNLGYGEAYTYHSVTFDNIKLTYPRDSAYFTAANNSAFPRPVVASDFASPGGFNEATSDQYFVFGFPKIIGIELRKLAMQTATIPDMAYEIVQNVTWSSSTPIENTDAPCLSCLTSYNWASPNNGDIGGSGNMTMALRGSWSQLPDSDFTMSSCPLQLPVRQALRNPSDLNTISYRNKQTAVRFTYKAPTRSQTTITRNVTVQ